MTDSQYLTEQNPTKFTQMIAWLAANKDARDIIASGHTGDVIQNWPRGNQEPDRAELEFSRASKIMKILEDSGVPYGIPPGNPDNVWGATNDKFNEYFPASRHEFNPWCGGHGPDGKASNFFNLERDGAKFLFLQMGFDLLRGGDRLGGQGHRGPPELQSDLLHPRVPASRGGCPPRPG